MTPKDKKQIKNKQLDKQAKTVEKVKTVEAVEGAITNAWWHLGKLKKLLKQETEENTKPQDNE